LVYVVFGQPDFIASLMPVAFSCSQSVALLGEVPSPLVCRQ
jgi:hypothetical protein